MEEHARSFGGGVQDTTLTPYALALTLICVVLILALPRKTAFIPLLLINFLCPVGQAVVLGGAHFYVQRIVVLAGLARLSSLKPKTETEALVARDNKFDSAFTWCYVVQAVANVVLFKEVPAIINQAGNLVDCLGAYYLLRRFLLTRTDVYRLLKFLAVITVILGVCMVVEQVKLINVFGYVGGQLVPQIREGKTRSQGPFAHSLTAGGLAAPLLPLFLILWKNGKAKFMAFLGIAGSTTMMLATNSSTSIGAYAAGLLAIFLWPIRTKMRKLRQGIVVVLVGLHMVMKAPVWMLIGRIDLTGSSSSYHRAELVDAFVQHFFDWCLMGVKDSSAWGLDMWDAQNQFVNVGEGGGLLAFIFFILLITRCFGRMGDARKAVEGNKQAEWELWFLAASLFSYVVAFFGVNLFDQSKVAFFLLIAMFSTFTVPILAETKKKRDAEKAAGDPPSRGELIPLESSP